MGAKHEASRGYTGTFSQERDVVRGATSLAVGAVLAVDNQAVWALCANGQQPRAVGHLDRIKRRDHKEYALMLPAAELALFADMDALDTTVRPLLEDPAALTARLGGLGFARVPIKEQAVKDYAAPKCTVSRAPDGSLNMQGYDPAGRPHLEGLMDEARALGVWYFAITSMNHSGEEEISNPAQAKKFISGHGLPALKGNGKTHPGYKGSYPIISFKSTGLEIVRQGNLGQSITDSLFEGYAPHPAAGMCAPNRSRPLDLADLPPDMQRLRGPELRAALLPHLDGAQ